MNKTPSHLISFDSESGGLARVCLALTKTDSEAPWQCPSHMKTIGADPKPSSTDRSIVNEAPCSTSLHPVTIPIAEAVQLLRGLVQHVLSPWRDFGTIAAA